MSHDKGSLQLFLSQAMRKNHSGIFMFILVYVEFIYLSTQQNNELMN